MAFDVTPYTRAKSDQLNADDLTGGPITVQIRGVRKGSTEQPVIIDITGGHQPFKPSKTALRVLSHAWGSDAEQWVGRWMRLYRDETVRWAGQEVGGVRIAAMSHIDAPISLSLAVSKAKKANQRVEVLRAPAAEGAPTATIEAVCADTGLQPETIDRWLASKGRPPMHEVTPEDRARLAVYLSRNPSAVEEALTFADDLPLGRSTDGGEE